MANANFTMSFQLKKNKKKKNGEVPIYLRITVDGSRFEMSIKRSVVEENWNSASQTANGRNDSAKILNQYMNQIETRLNRFYNTLLDNNEPVTIDSFKSLLQHGEKKVKTLIVVFEENNKLIKGAIGQAYSKSTSNQYETTLERLKVFLIKTDKQKDLDLEKLDVSFLTCFDSFLRREYGIGNNTVMKYIKQVKQVVHYAMKQRYIHFDPFAGYKSNYTDVDRGFLTKNELKRIEKKVFRIERLEVVKDIFLFVCYTGLSFSDLKSLTQSSISKDSEGRGLIVIRRKKTGVKSTIPLINPAQQILCKYENHPDCELTDRVLPIRSNQKLNSYLEEIGELCGIDKHITMHLGRHTFATTVTLRNGVPIESVKQMLGHQNILTTQIYARVVDEKVSKDMDKLDKKYAM